MFISRELKKNNIAEYLLYMWQVEDLIRANNMDVNLLQERVIAQYRQTYAQKKELLDWYEGLIEMMKREGVEKQGHLQVNKNTLLALTDLHLQLLHSPKYPYYSAAYYKALPFIVEFRNRSQGTEKGELENCFDMLYGVWLLKLQHKAVSKETEHAVEAISQLIGILSEYYRKDECGELDF